MSTLADHVARVAEATSARARQWEVLAVERADTTIEVGSGTADATRSSHEVTLCLRVYRDGRVGTASTTQPEDAARVVQDAVLGAEYGPEAAWQPAPVPPGPPASPGNTPAPGPSHGHAHAAAGVRHLAAELGSLQHETGLMLHGTVRHTEQAVHRAAPSGMTADHHQFFCLSAVAEGTTSPHLRLPWDGWTRSPVLPAGLQDWLRTAAAWDALPDDLPVTAQPELLLAPAALHTLLTPLVTALGGTAAAAGRSFLSGRLGTALLHSSLSLADQPPGAQAGDDDGTGGLAWPRTDDDGVPCAPLTLVEHGMPVRTYHSRHTAAAAGESPTGHGFRGNALRRTMLRPVTPVLNGATLRASPDRAGSFAELVGEISDGILIESLLGGQQRSGLSPVVEGRIRLGFVIQHGKVKGMLRPGPVSLDLREILGTRFVAATERRRAVSRIWSARLPFVLAAADGPGNATRRSS